uniref:Uncharacterized protein n=1 Tax=Anguilla anguilla TaxID=7936 RepID=A0A0E9X001_ANGAN
MQCGKSHKWTITLFHYSFHYLRLSLEKPHPKKTE